MENINFNEKVEFRFTGLLVGWIVGVIIQVILFRQNHLIPLPAWWILQSTGFFIIFLIWVALNWKAIKSRIKKNNLK